MPTSSTSRTPPRPRAESGIVNREIYTDPSEDIAREQARMIEAIPGGTAGPYSSSSPASAGHASNGSAGTPRSGKRQDFSNEKFSKKDNKLGDYFLGKTLGAGEFAKVRIGWKMDGGVEVAVKMISRSGLDNKARLDKVEREIAILKTVNHPNIIKMHEIVETSRIIGIVMEYASRGELFEYIARERYLKDGAARRLFAQLVSGVGYLHKKGIIHRDLKLENLLLDRNHNLIITDFGFANTFDPTDELGERVEGSLHRRSFIKKHDLETIQSNGFRRGDLMATSCGSPCYAAPELVVSDTIYTGRKVDVWSCGVILYAMLAGYLPFDDDPSNPEGDNINLLYKYIVSAPLVFPEHVTPHARDLLRRILVPDPRLRADLFEVARHSWLSEFAHVVESITSGPSVAAEAARAAIADGHALPPPLTRSASVREATKISSAPSPVGGLSSSKHGKTQITQEAERGPTPREAKRRTVQLEYLSPQTQTQQAEASDAPAPYTTSHTANNFPQSSLGISEQQRTRVASDGPITASKSTTRKPVPSSAKNVPTTSRREPPRAISDSNVLNSQPITSTYSTTPPVTARPPTQGSVSGTMSGTSRLPQRGSYGLPAVATVAPTNVEGRISQPPPSRGKMDQISGASPETNHATLASAKPSQDGDEQQRRRDSATVADAAQHKQKRNSTFGSIGDRIFGRSNSKGPHPGGEEKRRTTEQPRVQQQQYYEPGEGGTWTVSTEQSQAQRPARTDRMYPPSSMRPVNVAPAAETATPRRSTESSRRSFGFSRKSFDLSNLGGSSTKEKRSSRRFSFIPRLGSSSSKQSFNPPNSDGSVYSPGETANASREAMPQPNNPPAANYRDNTLDMDPRSRYEAFGPAYERVSDVPIQRITRGGGENIVNNNSSRGPEAGVEQPRKLEKRTKQYEKDQKKRFSMNIDDVKRDYSGGSSGVPSGSANATAGVPPPSSSTRKSSTTSKVMGFFKGRRTSQAV